LSSSADPHSAVTFDGVSAGDLAQRLGIPRIELFDDVTSTLDVAHRIAPDAPGGTLVLADRQTAGRGRHGRRWDSAPRAGIWLTLIERPTDTRALDVLSLRCGLRAAAALDALAGRAISLKWPNDLYLHGRKLAGILIETAAPASGGTQAPRYAVLNVAAPELDTASGLPQGTKRLDALQLLVPALRDAARAQGHLTDDELREWRGRDLTLGLATMTPAGGIARGIDAAGELLIEERSGILSRHRTGSLTLDGPLPCS